VAHSGHHLYRYHILELDPCPVSILWARNYAHSAVIYIFFCEQT
jgi:hypothetical protein